MKHHGWPIDRIDNLLSRKHLSIDDVALMTEVGSTIHGISVSDQTDDLDLTVVRLEEWREFVNGPDKRQSMMVRTAREGMRSRMGDIDLQVYTVRKFATLASGGNPSILTALFSPKSFTRHPFVDWGKLSRLVASKRAGNAFAGYMRQQMERWLGLRGQRNVNRPELVEAFGYDTKYAGHVIRLGLQGVEYMKTGHLTLPLPADQAERIVKLRQGGYPESDAIEWAQEVERDLLASFGESPLPEHPNVEGVRNWLAGVYAERFGVS